MKLEKFEKIFLRVGSGLGVVMTIFLLRSEIFKPSAPDLRSVFLLSLNDEIRYAQQPYDQAVKHTNFFPVGIKVTNAGGSVAKNVQLTLFTEDSMEIKIRRIPSVIRTVVSGGGFHELQRLQLGDINPGDYIPLDENIWCQVLNLHKFKVMAYHKDGSEEDVEFTTKNTYDIEVRLSAENAPLNTQHLYLTNFLDNQLAPKGVSYYTYDSEKVSWYKKGKQAGSQTEDNAH